MPAGVTPSAERFSTASHSSATTRLAAAWALAAPTVRPASRVRTRVMAVRRTGRLLRGRTRRGIGSVPGAAGDPDGGGAGGAVADARDAQGRAADPGVAAGAAGDPDRAAVVGLRAAGLERRGARAGHRAAARDQADRELQLLAPRQPRAQRQRALAEGRAGDGALLLDLLGRRLALGQLDLAARG